MPDQGPFFYSHCTPNMPNPADNSLIIGHSFVWLLNCTQTELNRNAVSTDTTISRWARGYGVPNKACCCSSSVYLTTPRLKSKTGQKNGDNVQQTTRLTTEKLSPSPYLFLAGNFSAVPLAPASARSCYLLSTTACFLTTPIPRPLFGGLFIINQTAKRHLCGAQVAR